MTSLEFTGESHWFIGAALHLHSRRQISPPELVISLDFMGESWGSTREAAHPPDLAVAIPVAKTTCHFVNEEKIDKRGLLKVNKNGEVNILTDEAEGKKFKLTDGVDVSSKGIIYFTDASYKYSMDVYLLDCLEGRPYGRLLSFDPSTNQTTVLLRDLYFANGVSLSPDQQSLIFCESPVRRCRRYHIEGEKKGRTEEFIENLPGFPDNIRYDGDEHYLIGLPLGRTLYWDLLMKYPLLRKLKVVLGMHVNFPSIKNSGLMRVNLEGKPEGLYRDPGFSLITTGFKIGRHIYLGSLFQNYLLRIDITKLAVKS